VDTVLDRFGRTGPAGGVSGSSYLFHEPIISVSGGAADMNGMGVGSLVAGKRKLPSLPSIGRSNSLGRNLPNLPTIPSKPPSLVREGMRQFMA
jgi:hypothetical protein